MGVRLASSREPVRAPQAALTHAAAARFRAEVLPHLDAAYNLARYLARDGDIAEDIVQDAFVRAIRGFSGWRGDSAKAWLMAIVRSAFLDSVQTRRRLAAAVVGENALSPAEVARVEAAADPNQPSPEESLVRGEEVLGVRAVIERLPEPFRETLVLREMEEMSYKEIAQATATRIGTVMSRLARAREMLEALLAPALAESPIGREARP